MRKKRYSSEFNLIGILSAAAIVFFAVMALLVMFGFQGIFSSANQTVCQSNRGLLKYVYQLYSIVEKKNVKNLTVGVAFLLGGGYMTEKQAQSDSLSQMVWRVYDNGAVDVFCNYTAAAMSTDVYKSSFYSQDNVIALKGSWNVGDGMLYPVASGENRAIFGGTDGTDYTIEINAVYLGNDEEQSGYGIFYRASDIAAISGYIFQFDRGKGDLFLVRKMVKGKEAGILQKISMLESMGPDFDITAPHDITIVVTGKNQRILVDGIMVLSFDDSTFSSGNVGVRSWSESDVRFNTVTVTKN
jgi:hypothetical protein